MAAEELRPTPLGAKAVLLYSAILISFYAIPYTNLLFLMLSFLGTIGTLSAWWTYRNLHGLRSDVLSIEPAPANVGHEVRFRLDPAGRSRFKTSLALKISGAWHTVDTAGAVTEPVDAVGRLNGLRRGVHPVEAASVESSFPFGVLRARHRVAAPPEVIAYPEPLDLSRTPRSTLSMLMGKEGSDGDISGLREYRPGDALRSIHWKASARRRDFVVKETEADGRDSLEAVLDRRCDPDVLEHALSVLSALAQLAIQVDKPLTIHSQDLSCTYGKSHLPMRDCLAWLARARPLDTSASPPPPASHNALRLPEVSRA